MSHVKKTGKGREMNAATTNDERLRWRREYAGPAFLKEGFRPLFLCGALWAALAAPLWIGVWAGAIDYRGTLAPAAWHVHEMIFGFVAAAVGGFLLTAVPNWTGRLPVRGAPLAGLAVLWLAGRAAMWFGDAIGPWAAAALDLSYLAVLAAAITNEVLAGKNWRNLPVLAGLLLLLGANALVHAESAGVAETGAVGQRLAIAVVLALVSLIGGRIVPSFTRNWFAKRDGPAIAGPMEVFDRIVLAVTVLGLIAWIAAPEPQTTAGLLVLAGVMNFFRLLRWCGWQTLADPLVTILHVAYLWLAAGLALLGAATLWNFLGTTAALHVLTMGAMGTMILAVMTRASLGHTGRALSADRATQAIYALVTLALVARLAAIAWPTAEVFWLASCLWSLAFLMFAGVYGPMLFGAKRSEA